MDQTLFLLCIVGAAAAVTYFLSTVVFRGNDGGKLRDRLRNPLPGKAASLDRDAAKPADEGPKLGNLVHKISQAASKPFESNTREEQSAKRRKLAKAGIYTPNAQKMIDGAKVILLGAGLVGGYFAGMCLGSMLLGLSLGGLGGYLAPAMWLNSRIKKQQRALDRGLSDAIDLLVVCVEAGLTIDGAMQRVGEEIVIAHPALAREFEIAHMETRVGLARMEALKNLGIRTGCASLQALAAMLIQAERFGTSIAQALRIHAESLRLSRQHQAEESAAKATVKLSFPVVLFIFPAVLIVLAGPAAIGLFNSALFAPQ